MLFKMSECDAMQALGAATPNRAKLAWMALQDSENYPGVQELRPGGSWPFVKPDEPPGEHVFIASHDLSGKRLNPQAK